MEKPWVSKKVVVASSTSNFSFPSQQKSTMTPESKLKENEAHIYSQWVSPLLCVYSNHSNPSFISCYDPKSIALKYSGTLLDYFTPSDFPLGKCVHFSPSQCKVYSVLSLELRRFWQIYVRTDGHYGLKADKRQFRALLTHLHKLAAVRHCAECNSDYSFFIAAYFLLSKAPAVHSNKWLPLPGM